MVASASRLHVYLRDSLLIIAHILRGVGLEVHTGEGKSKAVVMFAGRGTRAARRHLFIDCGAEIPLGSDYPGQRLHVKRTYKHLGTFLASDLSMDAEASHRSAALHQAYRESKDMVSASAPLSTKLQVVAASMFSRLLHHAGTWPPLPPGPMKRINNAYMSVLRRAVGVQHVDAVPSMSDAAVLARVRLPPAPHCLRIARLALLPRLIADGRACDPGLTGRLLCLASGRFLDDCEWAMMAILGAGGAESLSALALLPNCGLALLPPTLVRGNRCSAF